MGVNPEELPLTMAGGAPSPKHQTSYTLTATLGALLFVSALLNVAQFTQGRAGPVPINARLGDSYNQVVEPREVDSSLGRPYCDTGLTLKCIDESSANSMMGVNQGAVLPPAVGLGTGIPSPALGDESMTPGENAEVHAPFAGVVYCRKDTWLLSCLFYKADINDELTDWKSVKEECDREPLCDGVNKYWTSDLWHISSSGDAPGCDPNLRDGNGTDASAFYKQGSKGWNIFTSDGTCREVDEWGNPKAGSALS